MMNTNEEFLDEFKILEKRLKEISQIRSDSVSFKTLVENAKKYNPVIEYKEGLIWDLYGLRNVFSHSDREKYIATVNNFALIAIKDIVNLLGNPPRVNQIFSCVVYIAKTNNDTQTVLEKMQKNLYTHVPIYDQGEFIGILSETTLLDWLLDYIENGKAIFNKTLISDINRKYLNSKTNMFRFIPPETSVFDALHMFENAIEGEKRLGALLISTNGRKDGELTGIITAWDIPKIKEYLK